LKILHINATAYRGGAAQIANHLHRCQRESGYESQLLVSRDPSDLGVGILSLSDSKFRFLLNVLSYRILGREGFLNENIWRRALEQIGEVDVFHIHNAHGYYLPESILSYLLSKPVVWTLHDFWLANGGLSSPEVTGLWGKAYPIEWIDRSEKRRQFLAELLVKHNPVLVTPTRSSAEKLKEFGLVTNNLHIVPHGIFESDEIRVGIDKNELRDKLGLEQDRHVFVFAASTLDNKLKGFEVFLSALASLPRDRIWAAYIVGGGGEKSKRMVLKSEVHGVHFVGSVDNKLLREYFRACDTYVSASYSESFGLTVVEALAEGARVVCSDLPVMQEVTDGHAQFFSVGDSASLAKCLVNELSESNASEKNVGSEYALRRYSNASMTMSYKRLYDLALLQKSMSLTNIRNI
jgi:glycosyltransferase involved in cell wall biosynthesis